MPAQLIFFDMSISVTPPAGHLEPLPITLGPNWQPNDVRIVFVSGSGVSGQSAITMPMNPDPIAGFTAAYSINPNVETHGVYYRRLASGDTDKSVYWPKPSSWTHFMFATMTVRGVDPATNPTAGSLISNISYISADTTTGATISSVSVPRAGTMVYFVGSVAAPEQIPWPNWAVSLGCPNGWTNLVATDKSGGTYYQYGTDPALVAVAKNYSAAGSTGSVLFPAGLGSPAFAGAYLFLSPAPDVSVTIAAA